jgi:hypothetical protein
VEVGSGICSIVLAQYTLQSFSRNARGKAAAGYRDWRSTTMENIRPPFFCPKCGKEVAYTYDANTGRYTPAQCGDANCSKAFSAKVN